MMSHSWFAGDIQPLKDICRRSESPFNCEVQNSIFHYFITVLYVWVIFILYSNIFITNFCNSNERTSVKSLKMLINILHDLQGSEVNPKFTKSYTFLLSWTGSIRLIFQMSWDVILYYCFHIILLFYVNCVVDIWAINAMYRKNQHLQLWWW